MTDLRKLTVSLTKHGSHKIADLLEKVGADDVIDHTSGRFSGINIDAAQARKNLSALQRDKLPELWHTAKIAGRPTINALVMLAIVFSHHKLITAMKDGVKGFGRGLIKRNDIDGGKGFTNLKNDFASLNFITSENEQEFQFDLKPILEDSGIGLLAAKLFRLKLIEAGWNGKNDVIDECLALGFPGALGMTDTEFRRWTAGGVRNLDELPEAVDPDEAPTRPFIFEPGHSIRKTGEVLRRGHGESEKARLIHNDLLNRLYDHLTKLYGKANIATESTSGPSNTSIDLVRKDDDEYIFYELKTSKSLRKCIREAVPQLLEYSYWPNYERAKELIIVTTNKPSTDAAAYLQLLRRKFSFPIFHETIDKMTGVTSDRI